jgi:hypothetical protein
MIFKGCIELSTDKWLTKVNKFFKKALNTSVFLFLYGWLNKCVYTTAGIYLAVNVGWKLTYGLAFSRIAGLLKRGPFRPVVDEPGSTT